MFCVVLESYQHLTRLSKGGWLGLVILGVFAMLAWYTGVLLRRCLDSTAGLQTYPDIGHAAFGTTGRIAISVKSPPLHVNFLRHISITECCCPNFSFSLFVALLSADNPVCGAVCKSPLPTIHFNKNCYLLGRANLLKQLTPNNTYMLWYLQGP